MWVLLLPFAVTTLAVLFLAAMMFKKTRRWSFIPLLLCLVLNSIGEVFALHPFAGDITTEQKDGVIRVMSYNIWADSELFNNGKKDNVKEFIYKVVSLKPDVLILCELDTTSKASLIYSLEKSFPYNWIYQHPWYSENKTHIFSKYEISDCRRVLFNLEENGNYREGEDWLMNLKTERGDICLTACHFVSNNYIDTIPCRSIREGIDNFYSDLSRCFDRRDLESKALRDSLDNCNCPILVAGDLNDVGGSKVLRNVSGNDLAVAWWEGGFGYGATFEDGLLRLRLDHILYSKKDFELQGVKVLKDWKYSDHYPIVADFKFK